MLSAKLAFGLQSAVTHKSLVCVKVTTAPSEDCPVLRGTGVFIQGHYTPGHICDLSQLVGLGAPAETGTGVGGAAEHRAPRTAHHRPGARGGTKAEGGGADLR